MPEPSAKDIKWMQFCIAGAEIFSTCSRRQYFCIILDNKGHVLGTGTNGVPSGFVHCDQGGCPRAVNDPAPGSSYHDCYAIHAEGNALLHSNYSERAGGVTLIINGPPCFDCAKLIANGGVRKLVYIPDSSYSDWPKVEGFLETADIIMVPVTQEYL